MEQITLESTERFLQSYRSTKNQILALRSEKLRNDFQRLADGWLPLHQKLEKRNRIQARNFNIFDILGVEYNEVSTHSAFLANLLNPLGTHAQKHLFLENFLLMCVKKDQAFPQPIGDLNECSWSVEREKITSYGNLDIVISSRSLSYLLVIENKVYASEQPGQLKRYADWMKTQRHIYKGQALIYLTPTGMKSSTHARNQHFRLSYTEDISGWLTESMLHIKASRVQETVQQYLEIIDAL